MALVLAARDCDAATAGLVRARDVDRCVADGDGVVCRPAACALAREREELAAQVALAAEGSLAGREEAREAEALHARVRDRRRITGQERAAVEPCDCLVRPGRDFPAAR